MKYRLFNMRKFIIVLLLFISLGFSSYAQKRPAGYVEGKVLPQIPVEFQNIERIWSLEGLDLPWALSDTNGDGVYDVAFTVYDKTLFTKQEIIDSDFDGYIDEFAYYNDRGKVIFQEFDTNNDRKVDYWAEILNGERVIRIQRDMNYDGYVNRDYNFMRR